MTTKETNHLEARMTRGLALLENNGKSILENADGSFAVPSQTSNKTYEVRLLGDRFVCTCPDFEYRQIDACKHIHAVKLWIAEGQRIHYNFVKPHQALNGKTPAEKAGIKIKGKNKWMTMIQNTCKNDLLIH